MGRDGAGQGRGASHKAAAESSPVVDAPGVVPPQHIPQLRMDPLSEHGHLSLLLLPLPLPLLLLLLLLLMLLLLLSLRRDLRLLALLLLLLGPSAAMCPGSLLLLSVGGHGLPPLRWSGALAGSPCCQWACRTPPSPAP